MGRFTVRRTTIRKRMRAKLQELKQELRTRMPDPFLKPVDGSDWSCRVTSPTTRYQGT